MKRYLFIYRPLILVVLLNIVSAFGFALSLSAIPISFSNYGQTIILEKIKDNDYQIKNSHRFRLTNRIVVKTTLTTTKQQIRNLHPSLLKVTELYRMEKGAYFVIDINSVNEIAEVIKQLSKSTIILQIQPDLLQKTVRNSHLRNKDNKNHYISKLNIDHFWEKTKGKGVKIAIIDDGFDLGHEDLQSTKTDFSYDIETMTLEVSPKTKIDNHGTQVMGIIFAQHNEIGTDGIAPESSLIAIRHTDTWTSKTILSFYLAKLAKADVINCSWLLPFLLEPVETVVNDLIRTGRSGKGTAVIFAAGNQGKPLNDKQNETGIEDAIIVGSSNLSNQRLQFSNYGKYVNVYTLGLKIWTTSVVKTRPYVQFSGTSASAAIISGLVALLIADNKELVLKDIVPTLKHYFKILESPTIFQNR
ncbi:MAG: S8 family serine peptidase [Deltaproteobacteria bacterium]|nr:S8 family serine peptidase [Deltaproteobacteria bacterium]